MRLLEVVVVAGLVATMGPLGDLPEDRRTDRDSCWLFSPFEVICCMTPVCRLLEDLPTLPPGREAAA